MNNFFNKLYNKDRKHFFETLDLNLKQNRKMFIVTANPETFTIGSKDIEFGEMLLDSQTTIVPDGIGIIKAAKILKYNVEETIPGIDIASHLLKIANEHSYAVALLGASKEVMKLLEKKVQKEYPNIKLVLTMNGYTKDKDLFFDEISKTKPDIVMVALGIPNQERLIYKHLNKFDKGVFIGVGGSFDVLSGYKKRAPKFFVNHNLEWLYRITKEPKRLKRFWNNNVLFIFKIRKYKSNKKNA